MACKGRPLKYTCCRKARLAALFSSLPHPPSLFSSLPPRPTCALLPEQTIEAGVGVAVAAGGEAGRAGNAGGKLRDRSSEDLR